MSLDLDPKYLRECSDGMEALIRALIEKYGSKNEEDKSEKKEEKKD